MQDVSPHKTAPSGGDSPLHLGARHCPTMGSITGGESKAKDDRKAAAAKRSINLGWARKSVKKGKVRGQEDMMNGRVQQRDVNHGRQRVDPHVDRLIGVIEF